jgi:hypothetical protein
VIGAQTALTVQNDFKYKFAARGLFDESDRHIYQVQDLGGHGTEQQAFEGAPAMAAHDHLIAAQCRVILTMVGTTSPCSMWVV